MNNDKNISDEKESENDNNDSSYTVLEDILYCSSPKTGIKSKSNIENKNVIITPYTSGTDMYATHFTFNIVKEASTDVASKEELLNSHKNSNIISDFSISNIKNSKLDSQLLLSSDKGERENNSIYNLKENTEELETKNKLENKKLKSLPKENKPHKKKKFCSSILNDKILEKFDKNKFSNNNKHKNSFVSGDYIHNRNRKKTGRKYGSIDFLDKNKKNSDVNANDNKNSKLSSINNYFDKNNKKLFKSHDYENEIFFQRNNKKNTTEIKVLKDIKKKLKNKELSKNSNKSNNKIIKDKDKTLTNKKNNIKFSIFFRNPSGAINTTNRRLNLLESNNIISKTDKKNKILNSPLNYNNDNDITFEDTNYISHPIKMNKKELNGKNISVIKSSKNINQRKRHFSLIKEIDRDYNNKNTREIKSAKKQLKKKIKKNKKQNTQNPKKLSKSNGKNNKFISNFCELKEEEKRYHRKYENSSKNLFSKVNNKYIETIEERTLKTKKSVQFLPHIDKKKEKDKEKNKEKDKEKKFKLKSLKSSIDLNKKGIKKTSIESLKNNQGISLLRRRHTTQLIKDKAYMMINMSKNKNMNKELSYFSDKDDNNGDTSSSPNSKNTQKSKNDSIDMKKAEMKINKITEDKLILNYNNKNETIELLSDKENIDNYYEFLDLCIDTLQEINLKDVPKSKVKVNFNFPKDNKNKKIALFDLDETLVHCVGEIKKDNCKDVKFENSHKIKVTLPCNKEVVIGINIRPHLNELFNKIKDIYNIVIFTASHKSYSDAVLNYIDPEDQYFHYRLYRDSCVQYKKNDMNFYVKDLDIFKDNYNLKDIIMVDNSILSFAYHINNGIPVVPFYDSKQDNELPLLCFYLLSISNYKDLREANKEHIKLEYCLTQAKNELSLEEGTILDNNSVKDNNNNEIISNIKINIDNNTPPPPKDKNMSNDENPNINIIFKTKTNYNYGDKDNENFNQSEKRLINEVEKRNCKRFNTVKLESFKLLDFFEKWKNAYLQLALKK